MFFKDCPIGYKFKIKDDGHWCQKLSDTPINDKNYNTVVLLYSFYVLTHADTVITSVSNDFTYSDLLIGQQFKIDNDKYVKIKTQQVGVMSHYNAVNLTNGTMSYINTDTKVIPIELFTPTELVINDIDNLSYTDKQKVLEHLNKQNHATPFVNLEWNNRFKILQDNGFLSDVIYEKCPRVFVGDKNAIELEHYTKIDIDNNQLVVPITGDFPSDERSTYTRLKEFKYLTYENHKTYRAITDTVYNAYDYDNNHIGKYLLSTFLCSDGRIKVLTNRLMDLNGNFIKLEVEANVSFR